MTHTDTSTEAVTPVAKEISGLASREAVSMVQGWEDAFELYHKAADQLLALAAERDTLAKQVEDMGESYSKFADDYLKCAERYQETVTLYSGAVEELAKVRQDRDALAAQLAEARNAALEEVAIKADEKVKAYIEEHGIYDTATGEMDYPGNGDEWVSEWEEWAEEILALKSTPAPRAVSVQESATGLLDACPNPIFDNLKPVLMGEFHQTYPFFDEDGDEVTAKVNISWTVTKDIIRAALRALAQKDKGDE